jgi:hypothetical protein
MIGAAATFFWGLPTPVFQEQFGIVSDNEPTRLLDDEGRPAIVGDAQSEKRDYERLAYIGLSLILFGFGLQLVATALPDS